MSKIVRAFFATVDAWAASMERWAAESRRFADPESRYWEGYKDGLDARTPVPADGEGTT